MNRCILINRYEETPSRVILLIRYQLHTVFSPSIGAHFQVHLPFDMAIIPTYILRRVHPLFLIFKENTAIIKLLCSVVSPISTVLRIDV